MVECARLEIWFTVLRNVGSNPTLSTRLTCRRHWFSVSYPRIDPRRVFSSGGVSQPRWFADKLTSLKGGYWHARKTSRQDGSQRATTSAKPSGFGPGEG